MVGEAPGLGFPRRRAGAGNGVSGKWCQEPFCFEVVLRVPVARRVWHGHPFGKLRAGSGHVGGILGYPGALLGVYIGAHTGAVAGSFGGLAASAACSALGVYGK